ncbi:helix-turn-helix domain-containing protein (plasmid) [Klebsiella aerogenes]
MIIRPKDDEILCLTKGQMTVSVNQSLELLIGHTFPYVPIGLLERYYSLEIFYQAEVDTSFIQLTWDEFDKFFFSTPQHSEMLCKIMSFMSARLIHVYYERNNDSGYATIRQMLHRYVYKKEEGTVNNEGIASFILKRTRLSRSYVFQILSALKSGGYITIKNGKLITINREIPKRF